MKKVNFHAAVVACIVGLSCALSAYAGCPSGFYTPMGMTNPANKKYAEAIHELYAQQRTLNEWTAHFFAQHGIKYDRWNNTTTLFVTGKQRFPQFFNEYLARQNPITSELMQLGQQYGLPTHESLGSLQLINFFLLASWSTDLPALNTIIGKFEQACHAGHKILCSALPVLMDRAQYMRSGTQQFGTIPHVPLNPVRTIAQVNALRHHYDPILPPISADCIQPRH